MKAFPNPKAAHEANNAVLLAAKKLAEEHGVQIAIVSIALVEGSEKAIAGVEYTRATDSVLLVQMMQMTAAALIRDRAKTYKRAVEQGKLFGKKHSAELLDRDRVGDEDFEPKESGS